MTHSNDKAPLDRLTEAYEKMLESVNNAMQETRENALPGIREYLGDVRDKMVELGELTREEADQIAGYIERDIKDAATYLSESGEQLSEWWRFDVRQVEERLLEMFVNVADQTKLELEKLAERARAATIYHTGEVTGPGTLVCIDCGKVLHFHKTGQIPPCTSCMGTKFNRSWEETES